MAGWLLVVAGGWLVGMDRCGKWMKDGGGVGY